ncbi:zinc finger protein 135-like isoform X1 [Alosa alosa]|uniref:zinc finger protein 135-like isoform X1 n=1 Tax=Alosa alosa TaxID=278164 RepID=UPI0020151389|nr:zinc finger protein 135-like isoform X1 [Alosa alosa]XP_048099603.1 zinc finger protein 135-like isoform X1 [Alosa alosa]
MDEIAQQMDRNHKQACINLEKATQFITQVLQHEVVRNQELCVLICRLEEREAEASRSLTEQVDSNRQLRLQTDELQKRLETKDNSLTQANQTVALLRNELRVLRRQLQKLQCKDGTFQDGNEWVEGGESKVKAEVSSDGESPTVLFDDQKLLEGPLSGIKEKEDTHGFDDHGYGEHRQSAVETADPGAEETISAAEDIKTELIEEEEGQSNMTPILRLEMDLPSDDPVSLAQLCGGSVGLVDWARVQGQRGMEEEMRRWKSDGDQSENRPCASSFADPLENPTSSWTQQTVASSSSSTELEEGRSFSYPPSDKSFSSQLKVHQRINSAQRQHHCVLCGQSFHYVGNLIKHQRTHTGERPYHCIECGKSFNREDSLKRHYRLHTGERPYHCSQCGKNFTQLGSLRTHQNIHRGERPYHCTQCGKRFTHIGNLKIHQRIHTGERPYHCIQCGKSFTHEGNLKTHQRIHTGERPFDCTRCGKRFSTKGNLKKHELKHTGEIL